MKKLLILLILGIFVFFGIKTGIGIVRNDQAKQSILTPQIDNNMQEISPVVTQNDVSLPQEILIPKINVQAEIEHGGIDKDRKPILPKDPDNAIWYDLGPRPGAVGSSVISGHYDKENGSPAIFWDMDKLVKGDEIRITDASGKEYVFTVTKKVAYPYNEVPLQEIYAASTDKPLLNLITCSGTWDSSSKLYSTRTVIYSEIKSD